MTASAPRPLSLFPLDPRCQLLTNLVWAPNDDGVPSLHRQKLWVRFPRPVRASGLVAQCPLPVGLVRIETAEDEAGQRWRTLAESVLDQGSQTLTWPAAAVGNLRVQVVEPKAPGFPHTYYFTKVELLVGETDARDWPEPVRDLPARVLTDRSAETAGGFAGTPHLPVNQQLGLAHDRPQTDRLEATSADGVATFASPVFRLAFSRRQALVTHLSWDAHGQGRQADNLLSTGNTRGAFPVVARDGERRSSESCGGILEVGSRSVAYRDIKPVPEIAWSYSYRLTERGFTLEIGWRCSRAFHSAEIAALRLPFDLYRSVTNVLAMPDPSGPAGLVSLPLVVNAPNHGAVRVTVKNGGPILARVQPLRVQAELWLDLIPGAHPLPSGLFEMPAGEGSVALDFELTRIFPFGNASDFFGWWELPPFYSFSDRETVLGALGNAWLNGLAFRPDIGRFANNSVADSVALCACYYADIAAYTPVLAPGLDPRDFIRVGAEQILRDHRSSIYSNWRNFPMAATSPLDCAWLYVASSGDWEWARRWRDAIADLVEALRSLEHENTGLIAAEPSGIPEEAEALGAAGNMQCQWADSMRSGHLESYVNAHAFRSLGRAAELLERLRPGDKLAAAARAQAERLRTNFFPTFHDPASGQIIQWIARDGRRFGFQSHMHLGAAIALGLVPDEPARELLRAYLARLEARGFKHYEWGLPILLEPIPAVCHNNWKGKGVEPDGRDQVGIYQNGAIHTHQTWYILQALYRTGLRDEANRLFMRMTPLARTGGLCGGLHSGIDWRHPEDGRPAGYEGLLAEQFHFLLAAITGYLGCELTIDGLAIHGPDTGRIKMLKPNFARLAPAK